MSDAAADIDRHGAELAECLLGDIALDAGCFGRATDVAAHQLLWSRYMVTGAPRFAEAVLRSLRAFCRSALVDNARGEGTSSVDMRRRPCLSKDLSDDARLLELLTWVWRVERCPELRIRAETIADWATEIRMPGLGFAEDAGTGGRGRVVRTDANGLMLVAFIEAGSVFERRDWLALAREVFDELVPALADAGRHYEMSRAAMRLFEAFGKQRYLDVAQSWVAAPDTGGRCDGGDMTDQSPSLDDAPKVGILARLHALTGVTRYAAQAEELAAALKPTIMRAGIAGAAAVANARTAARLVSIRVSGDPRLPATRELMRIALDCGLPDRLVLGPGAGGTRGERPLAQIVAGTHRLAAIDDAAQLRAMLAPGGLATAFIRLEACETVDSRSARSLT